MGRTNGKLVPFLKEGLELKLFTNLEYEDSEIFYIEIPRFEKDKCAVHEVILKAWYTYNGKAHKYINYSNAKSVFQAAMKKSIYLISLPCIGKRLRFRFATEDERKEKQRLLKEKIHNDQQPKSPLYPPSVSSSGYHSGSEESETENILPEMQDLNNILSNPEDFICDFDSLDEFLKEFDTENLQFPNIKLDDFICFEESEQIGTPVTELKPTPVGVPGPVKKYWLCTQKIKLKSVLQLICELQIIENENSGIKEGSVVFPNDVFEPGISYNLKKSFELDRMYYFFFLPNSV